MAKRSGLTILELLIILICIAILAAVLFPVFSHTPERPRHSSCLSNVKQLSLGVMQYLQDYDEIFPNSGFATVKIKGEPSVALTFKHEEPANAWYEQLEPYAKNRQMYYCPSDDSKQQSSYPPSAQPDEYAASYTMNKWTATGLKLENISTLAGFILLAERNNETQRPNGSYLFAPWNWHKDTEATDMAQDLALTRHKSDSAQGSIVGFADGHSKWRKPDDMNKAWQSGAFRP